jgi:hypothetical protein
MTLQNPRLNTLAAPPSQRRTARDPDRGARICVFEPDWEQVDTLRQRIFEAGLDDRVTVRHAGAIGIARRTYARAG